MRTLGKEEISQVSGGYYFYDMIQGAQAGALLGYGAFLVSQAPLVAALQTGVIVGVTFGLINGMAYDLDMMLWSQYYSNITSSPCSAN